MPPSQRTDQRPFAPPDAIGLIGTGNMGRRMGSRLLGAGFALVVHDRVPAGARPLVEAGATWAASPGEVASQARCVLASLPGPQDVADALTGAGGVLTEARPGDVFIDLSTNAPKRIAELAREAAKCGVSLLEAPVAGGTAGAESGTLTIMAGGDRATLARCERVLAPLGRAVRMGDVGAGNATKLINNLLGLASLYAIAEAMALGARAGLDLATLYAALERGPVANAVLTQVCRTRALRGDFTPGFSLDLACKDQELLLQMGRDLGVPLPLSETVLARFKEAQRRGLGAEDFTAVIKPLEEALGVRLRIDDAPPKA